MTLFIVSCILIIVSLLLCFVSGYLFYKNYKKRDEETLEVKTIDVSPKDRRKYND